MKEYCNEQQYCQWFDNTCKSIVTFADGSTAFIVPNTYQEDGITSNQLTAALEGNIIPGAPDEISHLPLEKEGSMNLRVPSVEELVVVEPTITVPADYFPFTGGGVGGK